VDDIRVLTATISPYHLFDVTVLAENGSSATLNDLFLNRIAFFHLSSYRWTVHLGGFIPMETKLISTSPGYSLPLFHCAHKMYVDGIALIDLHDSFAVPIPNFQPLLMSVEAD